MFVHTNFESGNIGDWQVGGPRRLCFQAPLNGAPLAMWFYFRLEGAGPGPFEFVITNLFECLEYTHWGDVRPVMRKLGDQWKQAKRQDIEVDFEQGEFRFRFDLPPEPVEIAYSYPYPPSEADGLLSALRHYPGVEISYPGVSQEGRPLPYVIISCTDHNWEPEIIWAHSREHAGEVSGGFTLDGFLRAVVDSRLRRRYEIHAMPIIDIDAVATGRYGKLAPPVDHHMCWTADSPRPEVRLAMQLMRQSLATKRKFRLLLNFHSPSPENDCYLVPFNPTLLSDQQISEVERLADCLRSSFPEDYPLTVDKMAYQRVAPWWDDNTEHRPEAFILNAFGANAVTLEIPYHASSTGTPTNPEKLRQLGAGVAQGLENYFLGSTEGRIPLYSSLPAIFRESHGWALWKIPWHTRLAFQSAKAWAVGDDSQAEAYFGAPGLYHPDKEIIWYTRRPGGQAYVKWLCYDMDGTRLLASTPLQALEHTTGPVPLLVGCELPTETRFVRPSFLLRGAFRPFEVEIK